MTTQHLTYKMFIFLWSLFVVIISNVWIWKSWSTSQADSSGSKCRLNSLGKPHFSHRYMYLLRFFGILYCIISTRYVISINMQKKCLNKCRALLFTLLGPQFSQVKGSLICRYILMLAVQVLNSSVSVPNIVEKN